MDTKELAREVERLTRRCDDLERRTNYLPARFGNAGAASDLPAGGDIYTVLMKVDDEGTVAWSKPRYIVVSPT